MRRPPRSLAPVVVLFLSSLALAQAQGEQQPAQERPAVPGGELQILGPGGAVGGSCPLKHTDVVANVAGLVNRTRIKQSFHNPLNEKIEAVYVFPLPSDAAVDEMVMTVGDRRVVGTVKKREDARQVYEQARAAGNVASLLDQERPNIFTQSVANIEPGAQVTIEIAYVETLKYEDGWYEFSFPTVVGPRYNPSQVTDAANIRPPVTPQGTRAGHDISLTVNIDAGLEVRDVECRSHPVKTERPAPGKVNVALQNEATIPNKDFILRYRTATDKVADALLTHKDGRGSFFTLILQPPQKVQRKDAVGRELVFVLDSSGSMRGFPITQARFVMAKAIDALGPQDTFNLITFSGDTHVLWDAPRPNTAQNREEAQSFLASRQGRGGTEMMKAIEAALVKTKPAKREGDAAQGPEPIRVVCFMTDGYVGNDMQIIDAVKKNAGTTRVFSFGIGNSVNRFLLDGMAQAGRGEAEYVTLESKAGAAAERFYERIDAPVLTDVALDFGGLPVADVYPKAVPDLFSHKPVLVHGRLTGDFKPGATITLRGNTAAGPFERKVEVKPAPQDASHEGLASLWARAKVSDLMFRDLAGLQGGNFPEELKKEVTAVGVEFRLMTQFTSFVAVEELTITKGGVPTKVNVPVEMPDGVSYEGIFGEQQRGAPVVGLAMAGRGFSTAGGYAYGGAAGMQAMPGQQPASRARYARGSEALYARTPAPAASGPAPALARQAQQLNRQDKPVAQQQVEAGAVANTGTKLSLARKEALAEAESDAAALADRVADAPADPLAKLHEALRGLADRVAKEGKDGTLAAGPVPVTNHKVDVMIYLADTSPKTLEALKQLGFEQSAESKAVRLVIGSIDVRKLADLAKLQAVVSVRPVDDC